MVASPTSSGKRKEIKPIRSRPRAMLCDALVRRELGSCCVDLDVSMVCGLQDDRPRGERGPVPALVAPLSIRPCAHLDHPAHPIPLPPGSTPHSPPPPLPAPPP